MLRVLALLLAVTAPSVALATEPGPACRVATVVDEMIREIRVQNHYASVDPRLVTEQATATPNLVRCQVCVLQTPYEMTRFGDRPVRSCAAHAFEVRIVPNGFVVRDLH